MTTKHELEAAAAGVGLVDRSDRVRLEITGPDRAKFLHNLTTNEIKRMPVGRGCEAFVTSLQGKTIGFMIILAADDRLIARADAAGAELALPHFRKYGVFEDVTIDDVTPATFELPPAWSPRRSNWRNERANCFPRTSTWLTSLPRSAAGPCGSCVSRRHCRPV